MKRYTVAVDFDGVIHAYKGWRGPFEFDPPVPGAIEWLRGMSRRFDIVIHTTRGQYDGCEDAVRDWLVRYGLDHAIAYGEIRVTHEKAPALVYIDDRGYRFTGANFPTAEEIHAMRPWWKDDTAPAPRCSECGGREEHVIGCSRMDLAV